MFSFVTNYKDVKFGSCHSHPQPIVFLFQQFTWWREAKWVSRVHDDGWYRFGWNSCIHAQVYFPERNHQIFPQGKVIDKRPACSLSLEWPRCFCYRHYDLMTSQWDAQKKALRWVVLIFSAKHKLNTQCHWLFLVFSAPSLKPVVHNKTSNLEVYLAPSADNPMKFGVWESELQKPWRRMGTTTSTTYHFPLHVSTIGE